MNSKFMSIFVQLNVIFEFPVKFIRIENVPSSLRILYTLVFFLFFFTVTYGFFLLEYLILFVGAIVKYKIVL